MSGNRLFPFCSVVDIRPQVMCPFFESCLTCCVSASMGAKVGCAPTIPTCAHLGHPVASVAGLEVLVQSYGSSHNPVAVFLFIVNIVDCLFSHRV